MTSATRWVPAVVGLLALALVGLVVGRGARAEEGAVTAQAPRTWIYDVRVVRIDPTDPAAVGVAPPWQPAGSAVATTTTAWAELLAGAQARGRTTILLDQRMTALSNVPTEFKQDRKRVVMMLRNRHGSQEIWDTSYVETGSKGQLEANAAGLHYQMDVRWEERPAADGTAPQGSTWWKGSLAHFAAGETLVLSHRQQQLVAEGPPQALEIYVFVTASRVPMK